MKRGRVRKAGVALAALLIVTAQLLAFAHSHPLPGSPRFASQTQAIAADNICGLCLLVLHAPLSLAATSAIKRPSLEVVPAILAETTTFSSGSHSFFLTRAPPSLA
jgi:hypothetical protein